MHNNCSTMSPFNDTSDLPVQEQQMTHENPTFFFHTPRTCLKIDGEYLSHLRFATDILILIHHMNYDKCKTKVMMENDTPVNNTQIKNFESHAYLGQRYRTRHKNQDKEIQRRIVARFARHCSIFKGNIGTCLKRQVYNSCILRAMTYSMETASHDPSKEQANSCTNKEVR